MKTFLKNYRDLIIAVATVLLLPMVLDSGSLATEVLVFAMAAVGCNLLLGYAGLMSFGQGIFFGFGSYALGLLLIHTGMPFPLVLLLTLAVGAIVAYVVGWIAIRQKGIYFVLITLALAEMFYFIAFSIPSVTGGDNGLTDVIRPAFSVFGLTLFPNRTSWQFYSFSAVVFLIVFWIMHRTSVSVFGRTLLAMRDNPDRITALGYNDRQLKLLAFVLSGAVTALAGGLYAMMTGIAPLESINLDRSTIILVVTIIGGTANLAASILGALFWVVMSNWLSHLWPRWLMMFGILLMAISLYMQGGLWGACVLVFERLRGKRRADAASEVQP